MLSARMVTQRAKAARRRKGAPRSLLALGRDLAASFATELRGEPTQQNLHEAVIARTVHCLRYRRDQADALDLSRFTERLVLGYRNTTSQLFQDLWVLHESRSKQAGFFVEFGATDGIALSNTYLLEHAFAWSGLLAEPNPVYAEALAVNRCCTVTSACIDEHSGREVEFLCSREPEYSVIERFADLDHHAERRREAGVRLIRLKTISLNDFLDAHNAPADIDYLSLDTEGNEFGILRSFDFDRRRVRLISVEHNYRPERADIAALLRQKGYVRKFEGFSRWDDWYVLRDLAD